MRIREVNTVLLLEEMKTDGHAPLKFICDDGAIYYCKYLPTMDRAEINFLAYEIVANFLLTQLEIPTPAIALVCVTEKTLNKKLIKQNRRLRDGNRCFGSQDVKWSQELQTIQVIKSKHEYNSLMNPEDIIKIAFFDLWVNNMDRGRQFNEIGVNYNLLLKPVGSKYQIVAFDHAFIFGGTNQIGIFSPSMGIDARDKLINTAYYRSLVKYMTKRNLIEIVNNFVPLLTIDYEESISNIIQNLPAHWALTPNLAARISALLSSQEHIEKCKNLIIQSKR